MNIKKIFLLIILMYVFVAASGTSGFLEVFFLIFMGYEINHFSIIYGISFTIIFIFLFQAIYKPLIGHKFIDWPNSRKLKRRSAHLTNILVSTYLFLTTLLFPKIFIFFLFSQLSTPKEQMGLFLFELNGLILITLGISLAIEIWFYFSKKTRVKQN